MKIIEGLKKIKDLQRKADDIRSKIQNFCADSEIETPAYGTPEAQTKQVAEWLQAHHDITKEIESLRLRIQKTNLSVEVAIEIAENIRVVKSIAAWIHRRKDLAKLEASAWSVLTNRNLQPRPYKTAPTDESVKVANVRKYYDQKERDKKVEEYTSEPARIDATLEVTNATTDLLE
jgi:hypothetical protein